MPYVKRSFEFTAWAITHPRGIMHTNWVQGVGVASYPGQAHYALFRTRAHARHALKTTDFRHVVSKPKIVKITLTAPITKDVWISNRLRTRQRIEGK
jgi:hypothetical protein